MLADLGIALFLKRSLSSSIFAFGSKGRVDSLFPPFISLLVNARYRLLELDEPRR